ncbi:polysaccharide biosynthesis protein [Sphingomonas sp. 37zxx]|uniref:polysaccharide biosynthesis protein n=1 Tax=Sphingomonas sp. 37zxx TaxID=1550073 RepID=UPI0018CF337C|nr:nucleoside-diphosphate sugar epimerase/dehydratase [Sphingomonas sp. 37zxx]
MKRALDLPRSTKRALALVMDAAICGFSVWLAFYLRLGVWEPITGNQWIAVGAAATFALPLFWISGLYRAIFRYAGWGAMGALARAMLVYTLGYASLFTFLGVAGVPRTIGIIQPILLLILIGGSRALVREALDGRLPLGDLPKVLIYGAGSSGRQLAAAIAGTGEMRVIGFIDDDATLHSSVLNGRRIFSPTKLPQLVQRQGITDILLAMPSATRQRRNAIIETLRPLNIGVRTLPGIMNLAHGRVEVGQLRELEIEDLLGRDVAAANQILFARNILGKVVLVTGAGGSIGSELCRQILNAKPSVLLLVDINEYSLYAIHHELESRIRDEVGIRLVPLLGSVRDAARMRDIMTVWRPQTVYHAAAYKHVPMVEHNPIEGVRNNVLGTLAAAECAREAGVANFVLISTDKAVRPTNVMGTSKRLAEMVLQAMSAQDVGQGSRTRFSMVRFGNVLGSSGSVVPLFRRQIKEGGPITLTHEDITRYFMTIPEAAQLVIQAGAMGSGGEVFILNMGEPVKIIDLARKMIALSGMTVRSDSNPEGDIAIEIVGLRPGEKLYEELLIGDNPTETAHPLIMKATEHFLPAATLMPLLDQLVNAMDSNDIAGMQRLLGEIVPEYTPSGELPDWLELERAQNGTEPSISPPEYVRDRASVA